MYHQRTQFRLSYFASSLALLLTPLLPGIPVQAAEADEKPFFFIQLTDPQFGMYAKNANFLQETANFEFAVATVNRLKPAFVVVTGDLVDKPGDAAETAEYLRIAAKLNRKIPLHNVPGNHDIGNEPTPESIAAYTARFGPSHYSFRHGSLTGIVLNSCLIQSPKKAAKLAQEQDEWLKGELEKAKTQGVKHLVVFQHHPWFLKAADEPNQYFNIPLETRRQWLDRFRQAGVSHVFAGHLHENQLGRDGPLEMVTTGAIGQPLGKTKSGLRVVIVRPTGLEHRYYEMSEIPNQIDLAAPKPKPKS